MSATRPVTPAVAALARARHTAQSERLRGRFLLLWRTLPNAYLLPAPEAEVRLCSWRKWPWDLCFRVGCGGIALEFQGGTWIGGAHSRGPGQERDAEKALAATALGWLPIALTSGQIDRRRVEIVALLVAAYQPPTWAIEQDRLERLLPAARIIVGAEK